MITMTPSVAGILGARLRVEIVEYALVALTRKPVVGGFGTDNSTGVSAGERRRR